MVDKTPGSAARAALLLSVIFWGLTPVATKFALQYTTPDFLLLSRFLLTFVLGLLLLRRVHVHTLNLRLIIKIMFLALCGITSYQILITSALEHISASGAGVILGIEPTLIQLIALISLGQRITRRSLLALILGLGGVVFVSLGESSGRVSFNIISTGYALLAALCWSIYVVGSREVTKTLGTFRYSVISTTFGSFTIAAVAFATYNTSNHQVPKHPVILFATVIFLSLFATMGAMVSWNYAARFVSLQLQGAALYAIPLTAAIGGTLLLGERLPPDVILGSMAVLSSIYLSRNTAKGTT